MTQKVIANIYKRQVTKTYNENGIYIYIISYLNIEMKKMNDI